MVQTPSWAADCLAASQEIPRILRNPNVHYRTHKRTPPVSLSWASPIQSTCPHPTSWRSILILSTHLRLGLPSGLFPTGFPTKTLYPITYSVRCLYCTTCVVSKEKILNYVFVPEDKSIKNFETLININQSRLGVIPHNRNCGFVSCYWYLELLYWWYIFRYRYFRHKIGLYLPFYRAVFYLLYILNMNVWNQF